MYIISEQGEIVNEKPIKKRTGSLRKFVAPVDPSMSIRKASRNPKGPPPKPKMVELFTPRQHNISGFVYGPGKVKVREGVGQMIREHDMRADAEEAKLYEKRAFIVGPKVPERAMARPVPHEQFAGLLNVMDPFATVDG